MRLLRAFRGSSTDALLSVLSKHARQAATEFANAVDSEPTVPLDEARYATPVPPPKPSRSGADLSGLAALLSLPSEVQALRADVAGLRAAIDQLRRALPPALLSVTDAAKAMNVSPVTIRRMVRNGSLAHVRVGRSVRVDLTRTPVESVNAHDGRRVMLKAV
jgi:excisionase family DNA binding protein